MIDRGGTHWGAIAFTLTAGVLATSLIALSVRNTYLLSGPAPAASESATSAPRAQAAASVRPVAPPRPDQVRAALVRSSASPVIFTGAVTTVVYLFRNTGSTSWVKGTPSEARLGIVGEDQRPFDVGMSVDWPLPTRPAVQSERIVLPGGVAQFSFRVKGTTPGRYQLEVAPVIDGVAWTDAAAPLDITVR